MNEIQWYYASEDQRFGPISTVELKRLAERGQLTPADLVWREGMTDWTAAGQVKGLFHPTAPSPPEAAPGAVPPAPPTTSAVGAEVARAKIAPASRHPVEMILALAQSTVSEAFVESSVRLFVLAGHWAMYVAMLLALVAGAAVSFQAEVNQFVYILMGLAAVPVLAVMQFAAAKFCEALDRVNRSTRATVASTVLVDLIGVVSMVAGLILLLAITAQAVLMTQYAAILVALLVFILCQHLATVSFVHVDPGVIVSDQLSPGEEALGTLCALLKASARVVPVAFGAGVCWGTIMLLVACVQCFQGGEMTAAGSMLALLAVLNILLFAALPMLGYVVFLAFALMFDVLDGLLTLRRPDEQ
ncbi:MAG TPA: DUF4339 domain-containing protein [Thermoguttaceae bacterium]|nr:DUF4339 domain-containing protein [Thermoguttaceae bacterium]